LIESGRCVRISGYEISILRNHPCFFKPLNDTPTLNFFIPFGHKNGRSNLCYSFDILRKKEVQNSEGGVFDEIQREQG